MPKKVERAKIIQCLRNQADYAVNEKIPKKIPVIRAVRREMTSSKIVAALHWLGIPVKSILASGWLSDGLCCTLFQYA